MPNPGTAKLHRLEENLGAAEVFLAAAELQAIDAAPAAIDTVGERYGARQQARIDR